MAYGIKLMGFRRRIVNMAATGWLVSTVCWAGDPVTFDRAREGSIGVLATRAASDSGGLPSLRRWIEP